MPCRCAVSSAFSASDISGTAPRPSRSSGTKREAERAARRGDRAARVGAADADRRRASASGRLARTARPAAPAGRCPRRRRCRRSRRARTARSMSLRSMPNGSSDASDSPATTSRASAAPAASRCCERRQVVADHHPRHASASIRARGSQRAGHLARRAARSRVWHSAADLVELVADVEDAAAFGGELAQRLEQLLAPPAASAPTSARP